MPVPNAKISSAVQWVPEPEISGDAPQPALRSWLTETGLLTARMRRLCARDFRLEVLADHPVPATDTLRRVLLWCGDVPGIYAETFLPAATRVAHPWLCALGSEPLGEVLQSRPDVRRDSFEFALLTATQVPADVPVGALTSLWARRSAFHIGRETLTVTEVFLPGILDCEIRHVRSVN